MNFNLMFVLGAFLIHSGAASQSNDTTFLLREAGEYYHAIYIEKDNRAKEYDALDAAMEKIDSAIYIETINELKKHGPLHKNNLLGLNYRWQPLQFYKGNFYVYCPSDFLYNNWVNISDSILQIYSGGEPDMYAIGNVQKKGNSKYRINVANLTGQMKRINICLIDPQKGIALFEFEDRAGAARFQLMVEKSKIRNFPLIVNYCPEQKQPEFEFETPPYKRLVVQFCK